jgi:hypothetical protein
VSKPKTARLVVVSATLDVSRAMDCVDSWQRRAFYDFPIVVIAGEMGVVPAFAKGIDRALALGAEVIACLHDDVLIEEDGWDLKVLDHFDAHPASGLCGFGGGRGLADAEIYQKPYETHQLARVDFISNMRNAEDHGTRARSPQRVACLDGFSQISTREFWCGRVRGGVEHPTVPIDKNIMQVMFDWGITHHAYDSALGCWAKRLGWEVWMLPVKCHHFGGRTAVGDPRYAEWAETVVPGGDATFHTLAHQIVYEQFRNELPIRV